MALLLSGESFEPLNIVKDSLCYRFSLLPSEIETGLLWGRPYKGFILGSLGLLTFLYKKELLCKQHMYPEAD